MEATSESETAQPESPTVSISKRIKKIKKSRRVEKRKSTLVSAGGIKKPHRFRPGTVALREIKLYQSGRMATELLTRRAPMERLFREIGSKYKYDLHFQKKAIDALREAAEDLTVDIFTEAQQLTCDFSNHIGITKRAVRKASEIVYPKKFRTAVITQ